MKFVPPDLRVGEQVFYWQEDQSKIQQGRKSGKWSRVEIIAVKGPMVVISTGASIFQVNASKLRRPLDVSRLFLSPVGRVFLSLCVSRLFFLLSLSGGWGSIVVIDTGTSIFR